MESYKVVNIKKAPAVLAGVELGQPHSSIKRVVFHWRLHPNHSRNFKVSQPILRRLILLIGPSYKGIEPTLIVCTQGLPAGRCCPSSKRNPNISSGKCQRMEKVNEFMLGWGRKRHLYHQEDVCKDSVLIQTSRLLL